MKKGILLIIISGLIFIFSFSLESVLRPKKKVKPTMVIISIPYKNLKQGLKITKKICPNKKKCYRLTIKVCDLSGHPMDCIDSPAF